MATFFKLDLSETIQKLQKLEKAINKEKDNLKVIALMESLKHEFQTAANDIISTGDKLLFQNIVLTEADKIIKWKDKK